MTHTKTELPEGWVPGEGANLGAMIVGEAPGAQEWKLKAPFLGLSGQRLMWELKQLGVEREDMYITNVVKWRPPNNATPSAADIEEGLPYLTEEIQHNVPRYILALGNTAFQTLVGTKLGITLYRGFWQRLDEKFDWGEALVLPTYHPAYILRNPKAADIWVKDLSLFAETWLKGIE